MLTKVNRIFFLAKGNEVMYCRKCGKELKFGWKVCPKCGTKIKYINDQEKISMQKSIHNSIPDKEKIDFVIGDTKITGRLLIKILAFIAIICFFCPLYLVSCSGQELLSVTGVDLTLGFEYMGEKMNGAVSCGSLFLLPVISFCATFVKKDEDKEWIKDASYTNAICAIAPLLVIIYNTQAFVVRAEETPLTVQKEPALVIMIIVNLLSSIIGIYLAYLSELHFENTSKIKTFCFKAKIVLKSLAGGIIVALIALFVEFQLWDGQ